MAVEEDMLSPGEAVMEAVSSSPRTGQVAPDVYIWRYATSGGRVAQACAYWEGAKKLGGAATSFIGLERNEGMQGVEDLIVLTIQQERRSYRILYANGRAWGEAPSRIEIANEILGNLRPLVPGG